MTSAATSHRRQAKVPGLAPPPAGSGPLGRGEPASPGSAPGARPVRVLVVDDSAFMRLTLSKHLGEAPGLTVVGTARDGREALDLIPQLDPEVITLDVEMPRLDGLATLREIMTHWPRPVVMLSSLTTEGAYETVQALTWGAVDFVAKPSAKATVAAIMEEVAAKVRAAAAARVRPPAADAGPRGPAVSLFPEAAPAGPAHKPTRPLRPREKVVVIGTSTGGPRALHTVMPQLPADLPAAVLVVQHMPAGFTRSLAERLDSLSPLAVKEAEAGDDLQVGRALLAPGGFHMTLDADGCVALDRNPPVQGVRPAVDVTMASVAQRLGAQAVGVILTGMGRDGTDGAGQIRRAGGHVIAEAEATCVVWGMPRSAIEAGVTDTVAPLTDIAAAIDRMVRRDK